MLTSYYGYQLSAEVRNKMGPPRTEHSGPVLINKERRGQALSFERWLQHRVMRMW